MSGKEAGTIDFDEEVVGKKIDFSTPRREPSEMGEDNLGPSSKTALLSPKPTLNDFMRDVIRLLQQVVEGNNDAISYGVGEFMRSFRITNAMSLSLLSESDVPDGPPNSIWTDPIFCKAFSVIMNTCAEVNIT